MKIEDAIEKSAQALKIGIHENWITMALMSDGVAEDKVPIILRWAKQLNMKDKLV